jgi:AraC-like DNA-binding protein
MLHISAIVLAYFISFVILTKKDKSYSDYLLSAWLGLTGTHLLARFLYEDGTVPEYPSLVTIGFSLPLIQGPFLFLYTKAQLTGKSFRFYDLLHFLPLALSIASFLDFHLLSYEQKQDVFAHKGAGYETRLLLNLLALYASGVIYVVLAFFRLMAYRRSLPHRFSNTEKIKFDWLFYLMIWIVVIWIAILFTQDDNLIFGAASLFVMWIGYFGIKQVKIFSQPQPDEAAAFTSAENQLQQTGAPSPKYQKSSLSEAEAVEIFSRLKKRLSEEKPQLNPELKLDDLAAALNVHPNHLSQVINTKEGKSFYDLINELRIQEFISRMADPNNAQFTILAVAFDCGFNSKTSFNRNFKKHTGQTPSDYLKSRQVQA